MKKYLLLTAVLLFATLVVSWRHYYLLARKLQLDRYGLVSRIERLQAENDSVTAYCEVLHLDRQELERLYREETAQLKNLKLRLRRIEALALHVSHTRIEGSAQLDDTLHVVREEHPAVVDSLRHFRWSDPWNSVEGFLRGDSLHCRIRSIDTLHQVIHRVPHRFLFLRWGTKAIRQEIRSSNPSTCIVYTDYVVIDD